MIQCFNDSILERFPMLVARAGERAWLLPYGFPADPESVGLCARLDARTAAAALWRDGVRLGASRQHPQRHGWRAGAPAGIASFLVSADRPSSVSGDDGEPAYRVRSIHLRRSRLRQGTDAADGVGVSVPENCGSGGDCRTAPRGGGKHSRVPEPDPALPAD